jgi:sugar/nucleoside kinase (ribokinase family)
VYKSPFLGQLEQTGVDRLRAAADVLILTDDEVRFVAAGESAIAACRRLLDAYPDLFIVLKLGAAGSHLLGRGLDCACAGFSVPVIDTIGAGDAYAAAYIWADLQGYSPLECGTIGNATGAASVMKAGAGRNAPTRAEVQALLDQHNTGLKLSCS